MRNSQFIQVGLIGAGIQASRSPRLHEDEARAARLPLTYQLIDLEQLGVGVEALPELIAQVERQGFAGVNITHPCKQAVLPLLNELSDEARDIGAVNTVVFSAGKRIGHNTDCLGFAESFRRGLGDVPRNFVLLVGAGGAGSAVAYASLQLGVEQLAIHDTNFARAAKLAERLCSRFGTNRALAVNDLAATMKIADGLIQATPIGMLSYAGLPVPLELLRAELWVAELIYFPLETELLRQACALGCRTLDGGGMAVFQASEAFRLFTGIQPDTERMLRCFSEIKEPRL
ncbi:MAG: shikimate dehydrogenase [Acidobacteria bacterium]|nr:shikimate dehydrogenase [Acidobacteriota bacterium]